MDITGIGTAVTGVKDILGMIFPNKTEVEKAEMAQAFQLIQLQQQADLAQIDVNKAEASSPSMFTSGWRPAMGWVCVAAFAAKYVAGPFAQIISTQLGHPFALPPIDMTEMLPILLGMLGLSGMRTYEKVKTS